jgi:hypothetical protein
VLDGMIHGDVETAIDTSWPKQTDASTPAALATEPQELSSASPDAPATPAPMPEWLEEREQSMDLSEVPDSYIYEFDASQFEYRGPIFGPEPQADAHPGFIVEAPAPEATPATTDEIGFTGRLNRLLTMMGMPSVYSFQPPVSPETIEREMATVPTDAPEND